jgi:hypothetical protein
MSIIDAVYRLYHYTLIHRASYKTVHLKILHITHKVYIGPRVS